MKKWEWIGVTVVKESRSKKQVDLHATTLLERVTFSQPYGEIVSVIEDSERVRDQFQQLLLGKKTPSDGLILGYSDTAIALRLSSLTLTQQTGKGYCQAYFRSRGISKSQEVEKVDACHLFSELDTRFNAPISGYSVSEKAQLLTSLSLHSDVELLCLDDYVVWTSSPFLVKVMTRLMELKDDGASIWLFTDQLTKVGAYCDRVIWLQFGRLREVGRPKAVQDRYESYLMSLHRMSLGEQEAFWAHGLASQQCSNETALLTESSKEEERVEGSPVRDLLPSIPLEKGPLVDEDSQEAPSRSALREKRRSRSQSSNQKSPDLSSKLWKGMAIGCLGLFVSVGGWHLTARQFPKRTSRSHPIEAGPLLSSGEEQDGESPVSSFPDMSQSPDSKEPTEPTVQSDASASLQVAGFTHTVLSGDSLSDLATRYGVTVSELMAVNDLNNETIVVGETLTLPITAKEGTSVSLKEAIEPDRPDSSSNGSSQTGPNSYTVVQGDTLFQIARQHGKTALELQQANGLQTPELVLGQTLIIPE